MAPAHWSRHILLRYILRHAFPQYGISYHTITVQRKTAKAFPRSTFSTPHPFLRFLYSEAMTTACTATSNETCPIFLSYNEIFPLRMNFSDPVPRDPTWTVLRRTAINGGYSLYLWSIWKKTQTQTPPWLRWLQILIRNMEGPKEENF